MSSTAPSLLERNLAALGPRSAKAAAQIRAAAPRRDLTWTTAPDGALSASAGVPPRQLASVRAPLAEADKFATGIDIAAAACVVVRGFSVGHHLAALARRLKQHGAVIVFEPDTALLRAVFERLDCTSWLGLTNVALITDPDDTGAIAAAASGIEAILAAGTTLVDHPPSTPRLAQTAERFAHSFTTVMKAVRTNVVTTLVQVDASVRNLLLNLPWYATRPGIADLEHACKGKPAVVVSAGPSLRRNIDLLARPGVRDRVVIIAVQTVLKTLLAKGIKPHFVTALDYHEISKRFYEGLTLEDVEGVTLVVEPKCSRAILEAFPGEIRCVGDKVLDQVLGPLARRMGDLQPGATVAHLAYYLARHLACDPVILIGQDLGFTDGQYYAPGAAIHQVWSSELSEFRTLEMLEWERIARMRSLLRKSTDQQGRDIYTDEQMSTYLVQFERDFMRDAARALTTIDATEGGVRKQHTAVMPLHEALERSRVPGQAGAMPAAPAPLPESRLDDVAVRLKTLRLSTATIAALSRRAAALLTDMLERQRDTSHVNALIAKVQGLAQQAVGEPAYWLAQYINQTGQFKRFRADRAIHVDPSLAPLERQRKEIERDIVNVQWLADAADHVGELLEQASAALSPLPPGERWLGIRRGGAGVGSAEPGARPDRGPISAAPGSQLNIWALLTIDPDTSALGTPRDLSRPFLLGLNPLQLTLARLAQCESLTGAVLLTEDPAATRRLVGTPPKGLRLEFEQINPAPHRARARAIAAARLWSRHCWRGGIANISCFDEVFCPPLAAPIMQRRAIDAAIVLGADWSLIDPRLVDAVIERHLERPDAHQLVFTQAPPGLGPALVSARVANELAAGLSPLATIGGLLGYIPIAPQSDPIAKDPCITTPPHCRDLLARCIPDSEARRTSLIAALARPGTLSLSADAGALASAIRECPVPPAPEMITIEAGSIRDAPLEALAGLADDLALTIITDADTWRGALELVPAARRAGFAGVHLKGPLTSREHAQAIIDARPDVVGVLCDPHEEAPPDLQWLVESMPRTVALPSTWVVPRLTRCDAAYNHFERFYDYWIMAAGAAAIDPLPAPRRDERIEPLPLPANVLARLAASTLTVRPDATVTGGRPPGPITPDNVREILHRLRPVAGNPPTREPIHKAS